MRVLSYRYRVLFITVFSFILLSASMAFAQGGGYANEGFTASLFFTSNDVGGEFDGTRLLRDASETLYVPDVERGSGLGLSFGVRYDKWAFEFGFQRTAHDAEFLGKRVDADYNILSLDVKRYFMTEKRVQPYLLLGLVPIAWLNVENASSSFWSTGDATFLVAYTGFNLGGGVSFYLSPRVSLNGGIVYRLMYFNRAKGVSDEYKKIDDFLNGSGLGYVAGISYTF